MELHLVRALFILLCASVGWYYLEQTTGPLKEESWLIFTISLVLGVLIMSADILASRRKLMVFAAVMCGLGVGLLAALALSYPAKWIIDLLLSTSMGPLINPQQLFNFIEMMLRITCVYLAISFILQTKDDFRFVIPYVEFAKQTRGARPMVLDTSVLIDGRIVDVVNTGVLDVKMIVPRFVLDELQTVADSSDRLKRNRGRRGLDVLTKLQSNRKTEIIIYDSASRQASTEPVDQKLVSLAAEFEARILTTDVNLLKVAQVRGVSVINLNDIATALRPVVLPGEHLRVALQKAGEQPGQGIGYMEDGTMVVVEHGRPHLGSEVEFVVTSVVQTSAGRMIFGRLAGQPGNGRSDPSENGR
jgi:uncharacterized protein YacL